MFLLAKEEEVVDIMISKDLIIEVADELDAYLTDSRILSTPFKPAI